MNNKSLYFKVSRAIIYVIVFLLPIFFLPWTSNVLDFNKQNLLLVGAFLALFFWLAEVLISGRLEIKTTIFYAPILLLVFVTAISVLFSQSTYGSFWGWPLETSQSFLSLLSLAVFFFLVLNLFKKRKEILKLFFALAISALLAAILGILQILGKFILPFNFTKNVSFNTLGGVNALGIFLASFLPLVFCLLAVSKKWRKIVLGILAVLTLALILILNFKTIWLSLIFSTGATITLGIIAARRLDSRWLIAPMAVFVVSLMFLLFRFSLSGLPALPLEVSPSHSTTLQIGGQALQRSPLFGSGPGTFIFNWSRYKPVALNQTLFWTTRFGRGSSDIFESVSTLGILGVLSLLLIFGMFIWQAIQTLMKNLGNLSRAWVNSGGAGVSGAGAGGDFGGDDAAKAAVAANYNPDLWLSIGLFSSWLGVGVCKFLYSGNLSLDFLFWLFLAGFFWFSVKEWKAWKLEPSSPISVGFSFFFVLILIFGIGLFYLAVQRYIGEIKYYQGLIAFQQGNTKIAQEKIASSLNHNSLQDSYWRDLSQVAIFSLQEELQKPDVNTAEGSQRVQNLIQIIVNSSKRAVDLSPTNVANWTTRGFVFRNLLAIITGAYEWGVASYEKALELEPTNPIILTEWGQLYLNQADILTQRKAEEKEVTENLTKAREKFQKAIELKPDFALAHYQIAQGYIREGKTEEAIKKLEETQLVAPRDSGLAYQLGLLYYQKNDLDNSQLQFERAVMLNENYSNARYFLGLVYDRKQRRDDAIAQFERVEQLNPDNVEIKNILANLRAGKPALEAATLAPQPITETLPEQLKQPEQPSPTPRPKPLPRKR